MQEPICILHGYVLACTLHQNQRWRASSAFYSKNFGQVLKQTNWRIEGTHGAANLLGLNPSTLRGRMRKEGIHRP